MKQKITNRTKILIIFCLFILPLLFSGWVFYAQSQAHNAIKTQIKQQKAALLEVTEETQFLSEAKDFNRELAKKIDLYLSLAEILMVLNGIMAVMIIRHQKKEKKYAL